MLTVHELRDCGLTDKAVWVRARNGRLHRVHRGVYAVGHPSVSIEGRFLAAVKACGEGAALSHRAAGALWGIVPWEESEVEVTVATPGTRRHQGVRVHRTNWLERRDLRTRDRITVTSPARTLLDLAALLQPAALRRAVRQAQSLKRVNIRQLVDVLGRAGTRRGARRLARLVAEGPVPTRTVLEDVVLDLILRNGFERPDIDEPLALAGRRVVPDFRWAAQRLVVEADGAAWHDNKLAREDDAERQALLEADGERVIRVTWDQAVVRPAETVQRLGAAGAPLRRAG